MNEKLIQGALSRIGPSEVDYQKLQGVIVSYRKLSTLVDCNSRTTYSKCETILRKVRLTGKLPGLIN